MSDVCRVCGKTGSKMVMMAPEKPITHLNFPGNWKKFGPVCESHADNPPLGEGLADALEHEIQDWHNNQNSRIYTNAGVWKKEPYQSSEPAVEDPVFDTGVVPELETVPSTPEDEAKLVAARERMAHARSMKGKGGTS